MEQAEEMLLPDGRLSSADSHLANLLFSGEVQDLPGHLIGRKKFSLSPAFENGFTANPAELTGQPAARAIRGNDAPIPAVMPEPVIFPRVPPDFFADDQIFNFPMPLHRIVAQGVTHFR
jgi:hypothetical protein